MKYLIILFSLYCQISANIYYYCENSATFWPRVGPKLGAHSINEVTRRFPRMGMGAFSTVYSVTYNGRPAVFKHTFARTSYQCSLMVKEIQTIQNLSTSPGIIRMYGCVAEGNNVGVILEKMETNLGDLTITLMSYGFAYRLKIYISMSLYYYYMHSIWVFHNDIKPANIMFSFKPQPRVKIIDFNTVCSYGELSQSGTLIFNAPEKIPLTQPFYCSSQIDVWAFLITIAIIESGNQIMYYITHIPKHCFNYYFDQNCYGILISVLKKMLAKTNSELRKYIISSLAYDGSKRPSMYEIHTELQQIQRRMAYKKK